MSHFSQSSAISFRNAPGQDLFARTRGYAHYAQALRDEAVYGYRVVCHERRGARVFAESGFGVKRWVIDGTSNDYLDLSHHPRVLQAVHDAVERYGVASHGAAMLNGNTPVHRLLERQLATFLGHEDVLLAPSGYAAMQAATEGLLRATDVVFSDRHNHASLETGMRLSGAQIYRYPHLDVDALERLLRDYRAQHRGALILSDGVFSASGHVAPVARLVELARAYDAKLMIDDAHGIGALGGGRGCAAVPGVDILAGTLGKAFVATGGFVAGPREVVDYIRFFGQAACSTSNISVANAAAALAALQVVMDEPERSATLQENAVWLRTTLRERGIEVLDVPTPILQLVCGSDADAFAAWGRLFADGVLTHPLPFPIVPHGRSCLRLRVTLHIDKPALHEVADVLTRHFKGGKQRMFIRARHGRHDASVSRLSQFEQRGLVSRRLPTEAGDVVVHYRKGAGPTYLLLHPLLFGPEVYLNLIDRLGSDAQIIAPDMFGHGESESAAVPLTLPLLARCVRDIWVGLHVQSPAIVIGSSMGGMTALHLALAFPELCRHLVLIGASAEEEEGGARVFFESMAHVAASVGAVALTDDVKMTMFSSRFLDNEPQQVDMLMGWLTQRSAGDLAGCVQAVLEREGMVSRLPQIKTPATVIVGAADLAEPVGHSEVLAQHLPRATLHIVPECGHLVALEQPDRVATLAQAAGVTVLAGMSHATNQDGAAGPAGSPEFGTAALTMGLSTAEQHWLQNGDDGLAERVRMVLAQLAWTPEEPQLLAAFHDLMQQARQEGISSNALQKVLPLG